MCQRRPADPTDPGDAADLSIMGYAADGSGLLEPRAPASDFPCGTFAQERKEINSFLTSAMETRR